MPSEQYRLSRFSSVTLHSFHYCMTLYFALELTMKMVYFLVPQLTPEGAAWFLEHNVIVPLFLVAYILLFRTVRVFIGAVLVPWLAIKSD